MTAADFEVVCDTTDRERWLAERRKLLTASDVPAVLGLSPWKPAIEVWAEKRTSWEEGPGRVSEPMEIGQEIEGWLLSALSKRTRCPVTPHGVLLRSTRWPWLGATLDGRITAQPGTPLREWARKTGTVEVKSIGGAFADDWISTSDDSAGVLPGHYRPQVVTQLAVTGDPFAVFGGLLGGRGFRFRYTAAPYDEREVRALAEKTGDWWHDHVENDVPPEGDGSERADEVIGRLWPGASGTVLLDDEDDALVAKLLAIRSEVKTLRKEDARLAQILEAKIARGAPERLAADARAIGKLPDGRELVLAEQKRKKYEVPETTFRVLRLPKTGF